jgi:hypothetical protein
VTEPSAIEIARDNALFRLEKGFSASVAAGHRNAAALIAVAESFHTLAIVALLADANTTQFAHLLALSGQVDLHCRTLDLSAEPRAHMASRAMHFADAIAAGDLDTAAGIATRCPVHHQDGYEYEEDYLKHRILQHWVLAPEDTRSLRALLDRLEQVTEGRPPPQHGLVHALLDRDAQAFDNAMGDFVARRNANLKVWRKTASYRVEAEATEGNLSTLGFAFLRMAELRGLATARDYDGMPSIGRVAPGAKLPPAGTWRSFDPASLS